MGDEKTPASVDLLAKYPTSAVAAQRQETVEFHFASGGRCELQYRDLVSIELDEKGIILGFSRHMVWLGGAGLEGLYDQLRRRAVSQICEAANSSDVMLPSVQASPVERIKIKER